jgi:hypothetical protein
MRSEATHLPSERHRRALAKRLSAELEAMGLVPALECSTFVRHTHEAPKVEARTSSRKVRTSCWTRPWVIAIARQFQIPPSRRRAAIVRVARQEQAVAAADAAMRLEPPDLAQLRVINAEAEGVGRYWIDRFVRLGGELDKIFIESMGCGTCLG